jgi:hypothetical protein
MGAVELQGRKEQAKFSPFVSTPAASTTFDLVRRLSVQGRGGVVVGQGFRGEATDEEDQLQLFV